MNITSLGIRVRYDGLVHASFHLCLPIAMVKLLSDPLIDFDEFDQFLVQLLKFIKGKTYEGILQRGTRITYNLLFLLKLHNLSIQLLQPVLQVGLVLQNGHFVLFLNS